MRAEITRFFAFALLDLLISVKLETPQNFTGSVRDEQATFTDLVEFHNVILTLLIS